MKWRISHPKDGFPGPSWVVLGSSLLGASWSQAGQESPRKQADSSMFKAQKKVGSNRREMHRMPEIGGRRSEVGGGVGRKMIIRNTRKIQTWDAHTRDCSKLVPAAYWCIDHPAAGISTAILLRPYPGSTPILLRSYSPSTRLLLAFCSRSALENRQKQAICSMFRARRKKLDDTSLRSPHQWTAAFNME